MILLKEFPFQVYTLFLHLSVNTLSARKEGEIIGDTFSAITEMSCLEFA